MWLIISIKSQTNILNELFFSASSRHWWSPQKIYLNSFSTLPFIDNVWHINCNVMCSTTSQSIINCYGTFVLQIFWYFFFYNLSQEEQHHADSLKVCLDIAQYSLYSTLATGQFLTTIIVILFIFQCIFFCRTSSCPVPTYLNIFAIPSACGCLICIPICCHHFCWAIPSATRTGAQFTVRIGVSRFHSPINLTFDHLVIVACHCIKACHCIGAHYLVAHGWVLWYLFVVFFCHCVCLLFISQLVVASCGSSLILAVVACCCDHLVIAFVLLWLVTLGFVIECCGGSLLCLSCHCVVACCVGACCWLLWWLFIVSWLFALRLFIESRGGLLLSLVVASLCSLRLFIV